MARKTLFYFISVTLFVLIMELIGAALLHYYSRSNDFENMRNYNKIRKLLMNEASASERPRFTGQAYLNYIMSPNFEENGVIVTNNAGYRGKEVPLEKDSNVLRILFLGGSTTYGVSVWESEKTFPAVCGKIVSGYLDTAGGRYKKAEIINGGLLWGTSFEILSHYLFKFKYYHPDVVVVHTGGNDAQAYTFNRDQYTPDYSHWRKPMDNIKPLTRPARFLMHSRLLSFIIIRLFYSQTEQNLFVHYQPELTSQWFKPMQKFDPFSGKNNAFFSNATALDREVVEDKALLFWVPFIYNPDDEQNKADTIYTRGIAMHNSWMKHLAQSRQSIFVDLKNADISKASYWTDDCHLNEPGENEKAQIVAKSIISRLQSSTY